MAVDDESQQVSVLAMKITSTDPRDEYDFILEDWSKIPIDHQSTICPAHVNSLPLNSFRKLLGWVTDRDWDKVTDRFIQALNAKSE